jgi:outer membrane protein
MFIRRRTGLAVAASALALLAPGIVDAETLADAVALAYQSNPNLQAQRAQLRALDESYVQARQGYRPQADVGGQLSYQDQQVGADILESNALGGTLSVSQPLYTGGRVTNAVNAAEADILSGREDLRQVEASVLLGVIQAYVDVRRDFQSLLIRQDNLEVLRRQLEEARARFEVGEITRTDVAQSEARLALSQAQLSNAQAQLAISRSNYAEVVGQNPGDLEPEPPLALPTSVDQAFDIAEQISPAIRSAAYGEQASRSRIAAARADLRPSVSLRGELGYAGPVTGFGPPRLRSPAHRVRCRQPAALRRRPAPLAHPPGDRAEQRRPDRHRGRSPGRAAGRVAGLAAAAGRPRQHPVQRGAGARHPNRRRGRARRGRRRPANHHRGAERRAGTAQRPASAGPGARDDYLAAASLLSAMGRLEARNILPGVPTYDPEESFQRVKRSGSVPWEPLVEKLDRIAAPVPQSRAPLDVETVTTAR